MRRRKKSDRIQLALQAAELAGEAVAATMRGDTMLAGIVLMPDPDDPRQYIGDACISVKDCDTAWLAFAGVWGRARYHCWMHDQRGLADVDDEDRARLLGDLLVGLDVTRVGALLRHNGNENFGFWVIELETVWPVVLTVIERLLDAAASGGEPPAEDEIAELRHAQDITPGDLLDPLADVLQWRLP